MRFIYALIVVLFAAVIHRDILFNLHAFGRHWDWSFYPLSDFYANYIHAFFHALKPNYLGYYDILSMNLIELALKSLIFFIFKTAQFISLSSVTIPVLYKTAVFIGLPLVSSLGIWFLGGAVLKDLKAKMPRVFFVCILAANLFYTFSLLIIFDLHGGALNRQLSSVFFPFLWAVAYRYYTKKKRALIDRDVLLMALFFAVFDISNIFYFAAVLCVFIAFTKQPLRLKLMHIALLAGLSGLINFYWLHAFVIGNQLQLSSILHGRRPDYIELLPHSASFTDIIFATKTPHDQITRLFGNHLFLYIPGITIFLITFAGLLTAAARKHARTYILLLSVFFFTVALAGGTYSIADLHKFIYSMPFFSFIGGALRYMPNVLILEIVLLLFSIRVLIQNDRLKENIITVFLGATAACWAVFLVSRGSIMSLVYHTMVGPIGTNHEAAALYDYDERMYAQTRADRLEYNILPVPSWYSPIFTGNIFPTTSQGSVIDNFYFGHGMLYTNMVPLFSSDYFTSAVTNPNPLFYSFSNIRRIMYGPEIAPILTADYNFSKEWIRATLPDPERGVVPDTLFYPHVYAPVRLAVSSLPTKNMFKLIPPVASGSGTLGIVMKGQNTTQLAAGLAPKTYRPPILEYKKLSPTKYRIIAHDVTEPFPLVISTDYYPGWRLNAVVKNDTESRIGHLKNQTDPYKILKGNTNTQASREELISYIDKGYVSTLGNLKEKTFTHYDYRHERETVADRERYAIDYISKNIKGTIQNDNLDGNQTGTSYTIPDGRHLTVNGYANGWIIDPTDVCRETGECRPGSTKVTLDFIAEFYPQRYFSMAIAISFMTIAGTIIIIFWKSKRER